MKRLLFTLIIVACGSSTTGGDGGMSDAGTDAVSDASSGSDASSDGGGADVANDTATGGDGGNVGKTCDPNNNQCGPGLLCCSEPTHMVDAMIGYFCEQPLNGKCPMFP